MRCLQARSKLGTKRSQVEGFTELVLGEVSLVVDLHLLVAVDLRLAAGLVVLECELLLHAAARVGRVGDEDSLAKCGAVITGGIEVEDCIARGIAKSGIEVSKGLLSGTAGNVHNVFTIDLSNGPAERL